MNNEFQIEIHSDDLHEAFARLRFSLTDMSPLMQEISGHLVRTGMDAFDREADPTTGLPWAPLKPATIKERERHGQWPGKKLQRSGLLAGSLVGEHGPDFAAVAIGQETYARIHQFGGLPDMAPGPAAIPARPIVGINEETTDNILDSTADYLQRSASGAAA